MKGIPELLKDIGVQDSRVFYWFWAETLLVLAVASTAIYFVLQSRHNSTPYQPSKPSTSYSWTKIRSMTENAVVKIKTYTNGMGIPGTNSNGSGWVTKNGYIVTCYHVLSDKHYIINVYPYLNGHNQSDKVWYRAKVIKANEQTDLALLQVVSKHATRLDTLKKGLALNQTGSSRLILGFPGANSLHSLIAYIGLPHFVSPTADKTLVYSLNGNIPPQTSGLSGAPVLNRAGKVVGIADFRQVNKQYKFNVIPITYLKNWNVS
jgi:S1-C subfamily serine protease